MTSKFTPFTFNNNVENETNELRDLVVTKDQDLAEAFTQLYATEGVYSLEISLFLDQENISNYTTENYANVIIDMIGVDASTQFERVEQLLTLLDVGVNLIILSDIDSITLQNKMSKAGAIYVLWNKELPNLNWNACSSSNTSKLRGHSERSAKRILVVGTKGGVGVSSFSSFLAHTLASKAGLKVLLVEHDMYSMVSDVYLSLKKFKAKIHTGSLELLDLDTVVAESYVQNVQDKLDFIALDSRDVELNEHSELLFKLSEEIASKYNFIIDSVPISSFDSLRLAINIERYDRVYIICEPSIPSLRAYNQMIQKLGGIKYQTVFNLTRPEKDYLMTVNNSKKRIKASSSICFRYIKEFDKNVLQGGMVSITKNKNFYSLAEIVLALTGKEISPKPIFSIFKK